MSSLFSSSAADSKLSSLFSSDSRPRKQSARLRQNAHSRVTPNDEELSSAGESIDEDVSSTEFHAETTSDAVDKASSETPTEAAQPSTKTEVIEAMKPRAVSHDERHSRRKRKRDDDDDVEGAYMQRLVEDEVKEEKQRQAEIRSKKHKTNVEPTKTITSAAESGSDDDGEDYVPPKHETVAESEDSSDLEKASRTVFVGNVSTSAILTKSHKKTLTTHLSSFLSKLPKADRPHKIESIRFRSIAFSSHIPKKAAFARQELMDTTTKSTNAYVVYSTKQAASEAAKRLNGTVVLDRHIRVDEVAHPAKVDYHRCVFVGNLGFVDDESQMKANEASQGDHQPRKAQNGDVEEGLWRQFGKAGAVESVRVVRDPKTRVGKGIAYVQFSDENAVEAALLFNDKKYPPLLPRKLRVTRAKKFKRNQTPSAESSRTAKKPTKGRTGPDASQQSLRGRVKKMLGRAGAANMRSTNDREMKINGRPIRTPESIVFEGHRASSKQGNKGLKLGKSGGKKGKPTTRSAKRGGAWKAKAGKEVKA